MKGGTCGVPVTAKQVTVKVTASEGTKQGTVQLYPGNVTRKCRVRCAHHDR